jgi:hypothetical protein
VPVGAQALGFRPLAHLGTVLVVLESSVHALDSSRGGLVWGYQLGVGEKVGAMQTPLMELQGENGTVVVGSTSARNKTVVTALDLMSGKFKWGRTVNGTAQEGEGPGAGPGAARPTGMVLVGGRVLVETCKGASCCLRAFNASTGQKRWVLCVEAKRGVDATHPQAQFAIWLVTLITGGSIILLVIVAIVLYVHRLHDEKHLLLHEEQGLVLDEGSPRSRRHPWHPSSHRVLSEAVQKGLSGITPTRNYRPLPYKPPEPEDDDSPRRRFEGSPAVVTEVTGGGGVHGSEGLRGMVEGVGGAGGGGGGVMEARDGQMVDGGRWYGSLPRVQHGS